MGIRRLKSGRYQATYENKRLGIQRLRRNFPSKREAQEWEAAARAGVHQALIGRTAPAIFGEALERYLSEISPGIKSHEQNKAIAETLAWPFKFTSRFVCLLDVPLEAPPGQLQIVSAMSAWLADMRQVIQRSYIGGQVYQLRPGPRGPAWYQQAAPIQPGQAAKPRARVGDSRVLARLDDIEGRGPYSADTLRTRQALVKAVLRCAWQQWDMTRAEIGSRIILERPVPGRDSYLTEAQLAALIDAARRSEYGEHLAAAIEAAALVGWRRENLLGLTWPRVYFPGPGRIGFILAPAVETKTGTPLAQPMSERLESLLIRRQEQTKGALVFHRGDGQPFGDFRKTWQRIKAAAGLPAGFRWHDLRHTWASRLIQAGATDRQLMELGGWSSPDMPRRYAHLRLEHLQEIVNK